MDFEGSALLVFQIGVEILTGNDSANSTATRCGIGATNTTGPRWDDFRVTR